MELQKRLVNIKAIIKEIEGIDANRKKRWRFGRYTTQLNGFLTLSEYLTYIDKLYFKFQEELFDMAIRIPDKEKAENFLNFLHYFLKHTQNFINETYQNRIVKDFPYNFNGTETVKYVPEYDKNLYETRIDFENHKIHLMVQYQKNIIQKILNLIDDLNLKQKPETSAATYLPKRFNPGYTRDVISCIFGLFAEVAPNKLKKSDLAKYLSYSFCTDNVEEKTVSKDQFKKGFYPYDPKLRAKVKDVIINMLNRLNSFNDKYPEK